MPSRSAAAANPPRLPDHLAASLAAFERDQAGVTVDCSSAGLPGLLPEEWADDWEDWLPTRPDAPWSYGDDHDLDGLWDACDAGDLDACDELYLLAPYGSDYEAFGTSCGRRRSPMHGTCSWEIEDPGAGPDAQRSEPDLSWLRTACESGDLSSCDDLFWFSPVGSDDEAFGSTCGNRREPTSGNCADG